jgi:hypothetical protein
LALSVSWFSLINQRQTAGSTNNCYNFSNLPAAGYSVPLEGFLYRRPKGKLRLLMDLSTSFNDVWVEQLTTRVVLPEGAKHIKATVRRSTHTCRVQNRHQLSFMCIVRFATWNPSVKQQAIVHCMTLPVDSRAQAGYMDPAFKCRSR